MEGIAIRGHYSITVFRANGRVEHMGPVPNLAPDAGTEHYAGLLNQAAASSKMNYMAVGTATGAASMTSTLMGGEASRKVLATAAVSRNTLIWVSTFGGASESLTGVALNEVGIFNHASSGNGQLGSHISIANSSITLAASDLVRFEVVMTVGSHS